MGIPDEQDLRSRRGSRRLLTDGLFLLVGSKLIDDRGDLCRWTQIAPCSRCDDARCGEQGDEHDDGAPACAQVDVTDGLLDECIGHRRQGGRGDGHDGGVHRPVPTQESGKPADDDQRPVPQIDAIGQAADPLHRCCREPPSAGQPRQPPHRRNEDGCGDSGDRG